MTGKPDRQDGDGLLDALKAIASECQRWRNEQPTTDGASKGWALHLQDISESAIAASPTRDGAERACPNCGSISPDHSYACYRAALKPAPSWPQDAPLLRTELLGPDGMSSTSEADLKRAYDVDQPMPNAMRRAIEMLKLGRNGKSLSFQNDEIEAILNALSAPVPPVDGATQTMNEALARHYNIHPVRGDREAIARTNLIRDSIQRVYDEMCVKFSGVHSDDETDSWLLNLHASLKLLSLPVQPVAPRLHQDTLDRLAMLNISEEEVYEVLKKHLPTDMIDGIWQEIKEAGK